MGSLRNTMVSNAFLLHTIETVGLWYCGHGGGIHYQIEPHVVNAAAPSQSAEATICLRPVLAQSLKSVVRPCALLEAPATIPGHGPAFSQPS